ncbi:MAG TPA: helix-turn-helix domain-containing protein [Coriobacteriia bacterium]|nr:helix-turn-helix domain-containing protein [Coriobacteriia bacterium]
MDELLDIAAVAQYLGVSERTVYNKVRSGDLPAIKVGRLWRVRAADLEAWLGRTSERGGTRREYAASGGASVAVEGGALPSRADLEAVLAAFEERTERRLAFVGMLSRAYQALGWPEPVVVGGHAVEFWTAGGYSTTDIDLVGASEPAAQILASWSFSRQGRHWYDDTLGIVVEIPGTRLSEDERRHVATVRLGGVVATVLGIEDLILDRLNACVHWRDAEACLWAEALLSSPHAVDLDYLRRRAAEEDVRGSLEEMLSRVGES